jgi:hypothetical protein
VHVGGGVQAYAGMAMFVVVPMDERVHELSCVADGPEPLRERRAVLEGLEQ